MVNEILVVKYCEVYIFYFYVDCQFVYVLCKEFESRFLLNCILLGCICYGWIFIINYLLDRVNYVLLFLSLDFLRCIRCDLDVKFVVYKFYDLNFNLKIILVILCDIDWDCILLCLLN